MKLYIPDLRKEEGKFITYHTTLAPHIGGGEEDPELEISLQAAYVAKMVLIKGCWKAKMQGECSRCLEKCEYQIKEDFYEEFEQLGLTSNSPEQDRGGAPEERELFVFSGDTLDLNEYFRQSFLISRPLKILCRDQCKGLCPVCGANLNDQPCCCPEENLDPRWELLLKLKEKK